MARKEFQGRSATVYLPSKENLDGWLQDASQFGCTISEYIFEMVEKARHPSEKGPDLTRENSDLKTQNHKLEQEIKLLKINLDHAQAEIYKLRFVGFEKVDSEEAREYDPTLVEMLKKGSVLDSQEILAGLGIDIKDSQAVKLVSIQLEELRRFGLVRETANGWRWI
jgi:hypothetical protein